MIILTANGKKIINFNNIEQITIDPVLHGTNLVYQVNANVNAKHYFLGEYHDETYAIDVVHEIFDNYKRKSRTYCVPNERCGEE